MGGVCLFYYYIRNTVQSLSAIDKIDQRHFEVCLYQCCTFFEEVMFFVTFYFLLYARNLIFFFSYTREKISFLFLFMIGDLILGPRRFHHYNSFLFIHWNLSYPIFVTVISVSFVVIYLKAIHPNVNYNLLICEHIQQRYTHTVYPVLRSMSRIGSLTFSLIIITGILACLGTLIFTHRD